MASGTQLWQDLGPCQVTWNSVILTGGATDPQSGSHGGVRVRVVDETVETFRDIGGRYDETITDRKAEVEVSLTGLSIEQLQAWWPGTTIGGGTKKKITINKPVGTSLRGLAQAMTIKPVSGNTVSVDQQDWIQFALASPKGDIEIEFSRDGQKVFNIMFVIFDNLSTGAIGTIGQSVT